MNLNQNDITKLLFAHNPIINCPVDITPQMKTIYIFTQWFSQIIPPISNDYITDSLLLIHFDKYLSGIEDSQNTVWREDINTIIECPTITNGKQRIVNEKLGKNITKDHTKIYEEIEKKIGPNKKCNFGHKIGSKTGIKHEGDCNVRIHNFEF